jgi:chemotaxis protein MotB
MALSRTSEIAGRKKRRPRLPLGGRPPEKDESEVRWLMSYSDFMMQLVCLFILLYSVSSVDTSKAVSLAQAWRDETGLGEVKLPSTGRKPNVPLTSADVTAVIHELRIMAGKQPGGGSLRLMKSNAGFALQLGYGMFERGSDRLDAQGTAGADLVADLLTPLREQVESIDLVGHASVDEDRATDLALNRAAAMLRRLTRPGTPHRLDGVPLVATGRGTAEPAADNTEESGRRLNRRVDFVVRLKKEP